MTEPGRGPVEPPREYKPQVKGRGLLIGAALGLLYTVLAVPGVVWAASFIPAGGMPGETVAAATLGLVALIYVAAIVVLIAKGRGSMALGIVIGTVLAIVLAFLALWSICAFGGKW